MYRMATVLRFGAPMDDVANKNSPSTETMDWTCLSVSAELREEISRQVTAGMTYDDYLRENLPVTIEE